MIGIGVHRADRTVDGLFAGGSGVLPSDFDILALPSMPGRRPSRIAQERLTGSQYRRRKNYSSMNRLIRLLNHGYWSSPVGTIST